MFTRVIQRYSKQLATQTFTKCATVHANAGTRAFLPLICRQLSLEVPSITKPSCPSKQSCATSITKRFLSVEEGSDDTSVVEEGSDDISVAEEGSDDTSVIEEERAENQRLQEAQNTTLRIDGFQHDMDDPEGLEEEVEKFFGALGVRSNAVTIVNVRSLPSGMVLCTFSDERSVNLLLKLSRKLRDMTEYRNVFLRKSLCRAYNEINYHVRTLKKEGKIDGFQVYNGTNRIRLHGAEQWHEITHMQDLTELELL